MGFLKKEEFLSIMYVYSVLFSVKCVPSKLSSFNFQHCHKCLLRSGIIRQKMAIKNSRHDYAIIFKNL